MRIYRIKKEDEIDESEITALPDGINRHGQAHPWQAALRNQGDKFYL